MLSRPSLLISFSNLVYFGSFIFYFEVLENASTVDDNLKGQLPKL